MVEPPAAKREGVVCLIRSSRWGVRFLRLNGILEGGGGEGRGKILRPNDGAGVRVSKRLAAYSVQLSGKADGRGGGEV